MKSLIPYFEKAISFLYAARNNIKPNDLFMAEKEKTLKEVPNLFDLLAMKGCVIFGFDLGKEKS